MSQINAQIDLETTDKLTYIQQQTKQELSDILRNAIDAYYQNLKHKHQKTPFQLLADASLVILAEELGHGRILSVDYRDFSTYR